MAKVPLATQAQITAINFGATNYFALGLTGCTQNATEANVQTTYYVAGTLSDGYCNVASNSVNGTSTLRTRINGGNGNIVISITASTTGEFVDASNTDSVSANDELNYSVVTGGSSGTLTFIGIITNFAASSNTVAKYINSNIASQAFNTTRYRSLTDSDPSGNGTETRAQAEFNSATTLDKMYVYVEANTIATSATTVRSRINVANGNLVVSITASTTGVFADTSNSDSIAANDEVCFSVVTPNTSGAITISILSVEGTSTTKQFQAIAGNANGSNTSTTTNNFPLNGRGYASTTEASAQRDMLIACNATNLSVNISANTATGTSTFTFRKDTADTALQCSIGTTLTGFFEDTSNSVSLVSTSVVNYQMIRGGTGTVTSRTAGCMITNTEVASLIKTKKGLAIASVKTMKGLAIASVKTDKGLTNV